ncbi:MAG: hypothetical protein JO035_07210 [Betaproteobacteria bacterium]|nr:hypothetical protein [Betaproteobacteria bacterium]
MNARRERGVALIAFMAIIVLSLSWMLVSRLNAASATVTAKNREHNAAVLGVAKQALIGYVASQATLRSENNPGALPCPEPISSAGTAALEGIAAASCTTPAVGRLPWRTLGIEAPLDANNEPLWYVVSPGWAPATPGAFLTINSNTAGQLTVDGSANAAVALIVAPGAAMNVAAAAGCTARQQARSAPSAAMNPLDYLECYSLGSPGSFVTRGASASFNDQAVVLTTADVLPGLEAAVADRLAREVAPALRSMYGAIPAWNLTSLHPVFPFAASFDPSSVYEGAIGNREGLVPMSRSSACAGGYPGCPPINAALTVWGSASASQTGGTVTMTSATCSLVPAGDPTTLSCDVTAPNTSGTLTLKPQATINPFRALRTVSTATTQGATGTAGASAALVPVSGGASGFNPCTGAWTIDSSGATLSCEGAVTLDATVCPACPNISFTVSVTIPSQGALLADHPLTDPSDATTGWFVRNQWYQLAYYAVSASHLAGGPLACSGLACLSVTNLSPATERRALLILAGRLLPAQVAAGGLRPSTNLAYYLENSANRDHDNTYVSAPANATTNDRFVIVDSN